MFHGTSTLEIILMEQLWECVSLKLLWKMYVISHTAGSYLSKKSDVIDKCKMKQLLKPSYSMEFLLKMINL